MITSYIRQEGVCGQLKVHVRPISHILGLETINKPLYIATERQGISVCKPWSFQAAIVKSMPESYME